MDKLKFDMTRRQGLFSLITALYQILGDPACVRCHHVFPYKNITGQHVIFIPISG